VPFSAAPPFPFALLEEGHVGVGLFMTLSGYLFAKLVNGQAINYPAFLWSRAVRLAPLLVASLAVWYILGKLHVGPPIYFSQIWRGILLPTLPNGAWSRATGDIGQQICSIQSVTGASHQRNLGHDRAIVQGDIDYCRSSRGARHR
jgi:hypothetical protein